MKELIKFELRKLVRSKSFYVCLGITIVLLLLNSALSLALDNMLKEAAKEIGQPYVTSKSAVISMKLAFSSNTATVEAIIVTIIVCEDFVGDVIKNIYSKGYTRAQVYFSKLISSAIAFFAIMIINMIIAFFFGLIAYKQVGPTGNLFVPALLGIFVIALAYFVISFSVAMIFKKIAPSIILAVVGPTAIIVIFALLDTLVIKSDTFSLSEYWLGGLLTNLGGLEVDSKDIIAGVIEAAIFIVTLGSLSFLLNNKKDAK